MACTIPPVTIFMDGFATASSTTTRTRATTVEVVGWDAQLRTVSFTGGFAAEPRRDNAAQGLLDQGADVLLPVGGPIYQSAAAAIRDTGRDIALIGVDADVFETDPTVADLLLTSILKGIDAGVHDAVLAAAAGDFDTTPYVGTLENEGVGLAAVPRLRVEGPGRPAAASSTTLQAGDHRRVRSRSSRLRSPE